MKSKIQMKIEGKIAKVAIDGDIGFGGVTAREFKSALSSLGEYDAMEIDIFSPGGDVFEGAAIYNAILEVAKPKTAIISGIAASMGSLIACACDKIKMYENSFFMIHNPWTMLAGDADALRDQAEILDKIKAMFVKGYQRHCAKNEAEIIAMMDAETWVSGENMAESGFDIEIMESAAKIAAKIDPAKYGFAKIPETIKMKSEGEDAENPIDSEGDKGGDEGDRPEDNRVAIENEIRLKIKAEFAEELTAKITAKESALNELQVAIDAKDAEIAAMKSEIAARDEKLVFAEEKLNKILVGFKFETGPETWADALKKHGGDYVAARRAHPEVFAKFMNPAKAKKQ